jgi:hypothetical protein
MHALSRTAWEILNATADDWENLEQIYELICFDLSSDPDENDGQKAYCLRPLQGAPPLEKVADHICLLMEAGLLTARQGEAGTPVSDLHDRSYVWRAWFRMTPAGRHAWESSEYGTFMEQEQTK